MAVIARGVPRLTRDVDATVAGGGKPVAELRPVEHTERRPVFGRDRGRVTIGPDFDQPLDDFAPYR